jgi:hypothetical protein
MSDATRLHGIWRLVSFLEQRPDGGWGPAFDAATHGSISYWPNGRMQVVMGSGDRPRMRGDWNAVPAQDKAACLDRMVAYAGSYSVQGDRVLHHVDTCWIPNWEGRDLVRVMSFPQPKQLLLATVPDTGARARAAQQVLWERLD